VRCVRENINVDRPTWEQVQKVLDGLGPEGMSGDETDRQQSSGFSRRSRTKKLRRVVLPWRNPAITELFSSLETYEGAVREECFMSTRGNRPLERLDEMAEPTTTPAKPIRRLPRNWYKNDWYRSLTHAAKLLLSPRQTCPIPDLVCMLAFHIIFASHSLNSSGILYESQT
jgi:hypothetical protein